MSFDIPAGGWEPREYQKAAWESWLDGCNRQLLIWHRRAGKDEINLHMHAVAAFNRPGTYWHMLPEYAQARKAIWNAVNPHTGKRRIDEAFPAHFRANTNEQEMFIRFVNGATWQVVGSDNYNSLVGTPPVGITFSEWALANPSAWAYLAPILAENGGWASFITTPRGNNHVKSMLDGLASDPKWFAQILRASDTGAVSDEVLEDQRKTYAAIFGEEMADLLIEQEYECSFAGAMVGAIWGLEVNRAETEGRIRPVEIDRTRPVLTAWDLGKAENNPIWCFQVVHEEIRVVDFYLPAEDDLNTWIEWLNEQGYRGTDHVPHDIMATDWGSDLTRLAVLRNKGRKPKRIARVSLADGIHAGREVLKRAVFHGGDDERAKRVAHGLDGLRAYRREWDDERKTFRANPVKDWAEHIGSAWRYLGLAVKAEKPPTLDKPKPKSPVYSVGDGGLVVANVSMVEAVEALARKRAQND